MKNPLLWCTVAVIAGTILGHTFGRV
ncbi:hypothetical protein SEA_PUREGLOBE5_4 [Arthrobacter phage Pureglobe5]|nr:hypothetical protein PBI_BEAGLE_4 [Arthrobacter phage Beagle]QOP66874.1 membrane protein [Arthrobacter phage Odyssey395]UYL87367.1 hypothetical protein SEA_PUREGLOBE5_4 [Arthrobacter phage Pureglobe5]